MSVTLDIADAQARISLACKGSLQQECLRSPPGVKFTRQNRWARRKADRISQLRQVMDHANAKEEPIIA